MDRSVKFFYDWYNGVPILVLSFHCLMYVDELDSYMYQTVGHELIDAVAKAMCLPLHRRKLQGKSMNTGADYAEPTQGDEVEDLFELVKEVKVSVNIYMYTDNVIYYCMYVSYR